MRRKKKSKQNTTKIKSLDVVADANTGITRNELRLDSNILKNLGIMCDTYNKLKHGDCLVQAFGHTLFSRFDDLVNLTLTGKNVEG